MNAPSESTTQTFPHNGGATQDHNHNCKDCEDLPQPGGHHDVHTSPAAVAQDFNDIDHARSVARTTDKSCPDPSTVERLLGELPELCARLEAGEIDGPTRTTRRAPRDPAELSPVNLGRLDALDRRSKREVLNHVDRLGRPHPGRPGRVGQGENRLGILPTLDGWAVLLEADMMDRSPELPDELPSPATISSVCGWLSRHLHWWADQPQWDEFAPDVARQHQRARALTGWQSDDRHVHAGEGGCGGLVVHVGADIWRCNGCGRERSLQSVMTVTLPQAAAMSGVPEKTLRNWVSRHLVEPIDPSVGERSRRYDVNQVRRVRDEQRGRVGPGRPSGW